MNAEKGNRCMINGLTGATREKLVWTFAIYREKGVKGVRNYVVATTM